MTSMKGKLNGPYKKKIKQYLKDSIIKENTIEEARISYEKTLEICTDLNEYVSDNEWRANQ